MLNCKSKTNGVSLFLVTFCLLILYSCNVGDGHGTVIVDDANTSLVEQGDFDSMFKRVSVVPLETREECIVSNIKKLEEKDGNLYVLSETNSGQTDLYRFDGKGRFLNRIGNKGKARTEYDRINSFFLRGNDVYVIDSNKGNMLRYTSDGKCVDVVKVGMPLQFIYEVAVLADNKTVLLSYGINFNESHPLYRLMDIDTGDIVWELATRYKANGNFPHSMHAVAMCGETMLLTKPIDKCIYAFDNINCKLDNMLEIRSYGVFDVPSTDDYMEVEREMERGMLIRGIFCAGDVLLVNFAVGSVVWNVREGRGLRLDDGVDYKECKTLPCIPMKVVASSDNCFITSWSPANLKDCIEDIGNPDLVEADIQSAISDDSNPILVRHYLK